MAHAQALGDHGDGGQHDLGGRGIAELRRAVVFHLPPGGEAGGVRGPRLVQDFPEEAGLVLAAPREGPLDLAEDVELHTGPLHIHYITIVM